MVILQAGDATWVAALETSGNVRSDVLHTPGEKRDQPTPIKTLGPRDSGAYVACQLERSHSCGATEGTC